LYGFTDSASAALSIDVSGLRTATAAHDAIQAVIQASSLSPHNPRLRQQAVAKGSEQASTVTSRESHERSTTDSTGAGSAIPPPPTEVATKSQAAAREETERSTTLLSALADKEKLEKSERGSEAEQVSPMPSGSPTPSPLKAVLTAQDLVPLSTAGRGQHGQVIRALHLPTLSLLAIKRINVFEVGGRRQIVKELMAYAKLTSPYVVPLLGAYYDKGAVVLASEYMDLGDLKSYVRSYGPMNEMVIRHVFRRALLGLHYIHSCHHVHRDIKPDNILLDHKGNVKIADFGLLKELSSTLSKTTAFLGTLNYLSPERLASQPYSFPADIWSMGLVIYFCATGKPAFTSNTFWDLLEEITKNGEPRLTVTDGKFSPELCCLIASMLRINPDERWTAAQLLQHPFFTMYPLLEPGSRLPLPTEEELARGSPNIRTYEEFVRHYFTDKFVQKVDLNECRRVVDEVVKNHFHGVLRLCKRDFPPQLLETLNRAERQRHDKRETETKQEEDDEFIWVRGYRPIVPEDTVRFRRIADIYHISPEEVQMMFVESLRAKRDRARGVVVPL